MNDPLDKALETFLSDHRVQGAISPTLNPLEFPDEYG
jgi:hypothetical protein